MRFWKMNQKEVNSLLKKMGVDVDNINMNMVVRGGRIYTQNTQFSERKDYTPWLYSQQDQLLSVLRSRIAVNNKLEYAKKMYKKRIISIISIF